MRAGARGGHRVGSGGDPVLPAIIENGALAKENRSRNEAVQEEPEKQPFARLLCIWLNAR